MSVLGNKLNEQYCHRLQQLRKLTDKSIVDQKLIVKILTSVNSYGYYQKRVRDYIPILNQVTKNNLVRVRKIAFNLIELGIKRVIIANTRGYNPVLEVIQS